MALPITLSNSTVAADALSGTVIGTFNTDGLRLQSNPFGYFLLVGRLLVATWNGQAVPGGYLVQVHAPGGQPASFEITITAAPLPIITFNPAHPTIPDTTPKGTVVAGYAITMSDGSRFTGTVAFGAPNFDDGGVFALKIITPASGQIIVNPNGPGVGPNLTTITDHVTLVATT